MQGMSFGRLVAMSKPELRLIGMVLGTMVEDSFWLIQSFDRDMMRLKSTTASCLSPLTSS